MHVLVPFAAPPPHAPAGRAALATLACPRLASLLLRLHEVDRDSAEETSFSPPHERVLARAFGWPVRDGRLPWAAHAARADGIDPAGAAWALVSPVHWHVGTDQVSLLDPAALQLDDEAARALFLAVQPLFAGIGWRLEFGHATRWYASHPSLTDLRCASLDRVVGRNVDPWLGDAVAARPLRRLQAEVQMLLHAHPVNEARQRRGLPAVNSFWLSGCGLALPEPGPEQVPQLELALRGPALAEDWTAWVQAWRELEQGRLLGLDLALRRGGEVALTLCGERSAVTFAPQRGGFLARLAGLWQRRDPRALLEAL